MVQPHVGVFRGGHSLNFEDLMDLSEDVIDEEARGADDVYKGNPDAVKAALKGDVDSYMAALGISSRTKFDKLFMKRQMKHVADMSRAVDRQGVAAQSKSADGRQKRKKPLPPPPPKRRKRLPPPPPKVKKPGVDFWGDIAQKPLEEPVSAPRPKGRAKRGFGFMSLAKALKQLRGKKLYKIIDPGILGVIAKKIEKARPFKMGKRGPTKRKVGMSAANAKKIAMWAHGKLLKRYPFSEKKAGAPEDRDARVMNKALYTRGLSLILKDLLLKVGGQDAGARKAERAKAKKHFDDFKKKLRLVEWTILRDLEYLGESAYREFMILVNESEALVEQAINGLDSLEECRDDGAVARLNSLAESVWIDEDEKALGARAVKKLKLFIKKTNFTIKSLKDGMRDKPMRIQRKVAADIKDMEAKVKEAEADLKELAFGSSKEMLGGESGKWRTTKSGQRMFIYDKGGIGGVPGAFKKAVGESVWIDEDDQEYFGEDAPATPDSFARSKYVFPLRRGWPIGDRRHGLKALRCVAEGKGDPKDWKAVVEAVTDRYPDMVVDNRDLVRAASVMASGKYADEDFFHVGEDKVSIGFALGEGLNSKNVDYIDHLLNENAGGGGKQDPLLNKAHPLNKGRVRLGDRSLAVGPVLESEDYHKLGAKLQHWATGEGDAIYKAGSRLFAGRKPWRKDVCDAIEMLQDFMMKPSYAEHEVELRGIISKLRSVCLG